VIRISKLDGQGTRMGCLPRSWFGTTQTTRCPDSPTKNRPHPISPDGVT
jgi:hypothetical protein